MSSEILNVHSSYHPQNLMKDRQQCVVQHMCTADWFSETCKIINTLKLWLMTQELAWNQRFKGLLKFLEAWNTFLLFILGIQDSNKEMHSQWALSEWISKSLDQTEHQERPSTMVHRGEAGLLQNFCPTLNKHPLLVLFSSSSDASNFCKWTLQICYLKHFTKWSISRHLKLSVSS